MLDIRFHKEPNERHWNARIIKWQFLLWW